MKSCWSLLIFLFATTGSLLACSTCGNAPVTLYGSFCAESSFSISLNGQQATGTGQGCGSYTDSSKQTTQLRPNQPYTLTASSGKASSIHVNLSTQSCYKLFIFGCNPAISPRFSTPV